MTFYIIPSISAFIFTCLTLVYTSKKKVNSKPFYLMVLVFALHHSCETVLLIQNIKDITSLLTLKIYYALTIFALLFIQFYSLHVSKIKRSFLINLFILFSLTIVCLILFSNKVIEGNFSINYSNSAAKGPLYILFQVYSLIGLSTVITTLIFGYRKANSHLIQIRCAYILLAFTPLILSCFSILILMAIGINLNATMILPLAISTFLYIIVKGESVHKLTDIRRFMPYSSERKTSQEVMEIYSRYAQDEISYRDCMSEIEKLLVIHKYSKNDKNASATAETMGMPRSSLYSIFNRLGIKTKEQ